MPRAKKAVTTVTPSKVAKKKAPSTKKSSTSNKDLIASFMKHSQVVNKDLTSYGSTLDSSIYSNINEYIDTGSYALNRLISGSVYGGTPSGRLVAFAGESGVGKSFAIGQTIKNAQEMGYLVIYYDSENAIDNDFMDNLGVNTSELIYFPIDTAEEFKNHVVKTVGAFKKDNKNAKIMICLDSLGNLSCEQEKNFIVKGTAGTDMGARAKANKSMLKELTKFCGKHQIPFVFTNHVMKPQDSNMQPMYVKNEQTGGKQATYMASAVIMLTKAKLKADEASASDKKGKEATEKLGSIMTCESRKNRLCQEEKKVKLYVSFKSGLNKFYGLVDDAVGSGAFVEVDKKNYIVPHLGDKKVHIKNLYNAEVFTKEVLDTIDEYCKNTYKYSKLTDVDDDELGDMLGDGESNE
jgi:RecA/RadA recombinase